MTRLRLHSGHVVDVPDEVRDVHGARLCDRAPGDEVHVRGTGGVPAWRLPDDARALLESGPVGAIVLGRTARPIGSGWWLVDGDVAGLGARRSPVELEAEHGPLVAGPQTHALYDEHGQDRSVEEPLTEAEMAAVLGCAEAEVRERFTALATEERLRAAEQARERRDDPRRAPGQPETRSVLTELQIALERSGLAPEELAARAGVPVETVRELLDGYADPSLTTAARLLLAVGGRLRVEADR